MRVTSEKYNEAKRAGAKPIIIAEMWTDRGPRAYGKQGLKPDWVRLFGQIWIGGDQVFIGAGNPVYISAPAAGVFEWEGRVLAFGDFRQSLAANPDSVYQSLVGKEMESYTLTLDNADGKMTEIASREQIVNYPLILRQGFDYPGFSYLDFITLFSGRNTKYDFGLTSFMVSADQSLQVSSPSDPSIDITKTYSLYTPGTGTKGATKTYSYTTLEDIFFEKESWTERFVFHRHSGGAQIFIDLADRWTIGSNATNYPYITYVYDDPSSCTVTADFTLPTTGYVELEIQFDAENGTVTFTDNYGHQFVGDLCDSYNYQNQFTIPSSTSYVFSGGSPFGDHFWASTRDSTNRYVRKYDAVNGILLNEITISPLYSDGGGVGQSILGDVWISQRTGVLEPWVRVYDSQLNYKFSCIDYGYGPGEIAGTGPLGIAFDKYGQAFVCDRDNDRIVKYDPYGNYISHFGSQGSGVGCFYDPVGIYVDEDRFIYVADSTNNRIQKFSPEGVYLASVGSFGSGNGEFNGIREVAEDTDGYIIATDYFNNRLQRFTKDLVYDSQITTFNGADSFTYPAAICTTRNFHNPVIEYQGSRVINFRLDYYIPDYITVGNVTLTIPEDFDGDFFNVTHITSSGQRFNLLNNVSEVVTCWSDLQGGLCPDIEDGTWRVWGETRSYSEIVETQQEVTGFREVVLPGSGQYSDPGENQKNMILPLPYGDLTENSDGAVWVCPLIDDAAHVFCAAGWPVLSVGNGNVVSVYVDGVLQGAGYTFDESDDYESLGEIAIITFAADPGGVVSVRMKGKDDGAGSLLTNPIDILEDWIDYATGLVGTSAIWQKDDDAFNTARDIATDNSYTCAGLIQANNSLGFWIQEILNSFLGSFRFDSTGRLQVFVADPDKEVKVFEWFDEHEHITLESSMILENVYNRVLINYASSFAKIDRRFKRGGEISYFRTADDTTTTTKSTNRYDERPLKFDFNWTRNTATVAAMKDILLNLYEFPEVPIKYEGQDFKYLPLEIGDGIQGPVSLVRNHDNQIIDNMAYELREKTHNLDNFTTSWTAQSYGINDILDALRVYIGTKRVYIGSDAVYF